MDGDTLGRTLVRYGCALALLAAPALAASAPLLLGPLPYAQSSDSPFAGLTFTEYFHLEDFEDGALSTPGVTSTSGGFVVGPSPQTDSVDGDDGTVDGSGAGGHSFFSGFPGGTSVFTFEFDAIALGGLPTHVGIVWTDVGFANPDNGLGEVTFQAFDGLGVSLGLVGPSAVGDGSTFGETAEDRFFGAISEGGIGRIVISMAGSSDDWEVDHLQYGRTLASVPEPGTLALGLLAMAGFGSHRRQSRGQGRRPAAAPGRGPRAR
ncbi:MAG: PEP-CTERM sorting domain-containing protein [Ectothiorhodospiraceae bacterium]|nr:PEP-CTERM sorting domain-containing protein [Ectothiorhodospiraceae bacterium]